MLAVPERGPHHAFETAARLGNRARPQERLRVGHLGRRDGGVGRIPVDQRLVRLAGQRPLRVRGRGGAQRGQRARRGGAPREVLDHSHRERASLRPLLLLAGDPGHRLQEERRRRRIGSAVQQRSGQRPELRLLALPEEHRGQAVFRHRGHRCCAGVARRHQASRGRVPVAALESQASQPEMREILALGERRAQVRLRLALAPQLQLGNALGQTQPALVRRQRAARARGAEGAEPLLAPPFADGQDGAVQERHGREVVLREPPEEFVEEPLRLALIARLRGQLGGEEQRGRHQRIARLLQREACPEPARLVEPPPAQLGPRERGHRGRRGGRLRVVGEEPLVEPGGAVVLAAPVRGLRGHHERGGAHGRVRPCRRGLPRRRAPW